MHGFERFAEVVFAGWLFFNALAIVLVAAGVARRYAQLTAERCDEPAREVAFDPVLTLTE